MKQPDNGYIYNAEEAGLIPDVELINQSENKKMTKTKEEFLTWYKEFLTKYGEHEDYQHLIDQMCNNEEVTIDELKENTTLPEDAIIGAMEHYTEFNSYILLEAYDVDYVCYLEDF